MTRHRNWTFTWSNYPENLEDFKKYLGDTWVFGHEIAPTTGTPHLQGYVEFSSAKEKNSTKFNEKIHWEVAKGDEQANWAYCTKDKKFETSHPNGFPVKKPGKRNDITVARAIIKEGKGMKEVVEQVNSYQAMKACELYLKYAEPSRNWMMDVTWVHGPSGSGKTEYAHKHMPNAWVSLANSKWFDGYDGQEDVIIDDLRPADWPFTMMLRLLDSKPFRVEVKGGSRQFRAKRIIITTLHRPEQLYATTISEPIEQLLRRITKFVDLAQR